MNFDKFKDLKPTPIPKPQDADGYFEKLDSLKPRPSHNKALSVIGTVAAAVLIVVIVSVWALLGRGLRLPDDSAVPGGESTTVIDGIQFHNREITDELYQKMQMFYAQDKVHALSEFNEENPLTKERLISLCEFMRPELRDDLVLSKDELSEFAYDMFRYDITFDNDIEYTTLFNTSVSLAAVHFVAYRVSDTREDGTQLAEIDIQAHNHFETVRFAQRGDLNLEYFVSLTVDETKKAPTIDTEFENIATKYRLDAMPRFELGEKPDFLSAKYHIAHVLGKDKWVVFKNKNGYSGFGIPIELFNETANELYGGIPVDDGFIALEDVDTVKYDRLNLIDTGDGKLIAPLEATGGLEVESYKFINAIGFEHDSKSAFRITYEITYKGSADGPARYEVCYIRSNKNFGLSPTEFISHKRIE